MIKGLNIKVTKFRQISNKSNYKKNKIDKNIFIF